MLVNSTSSNASLLRLHLGSILQVDMCYLASTTVVVLSHAYNALNLMSAVSDKVLQRSKVYNVLGVHCTLDHFILE
jgi:hypothetical protein